MLTFPATQPQPALREKGWGRRAGKRMTRIDSPGIEFAGNRPLGVDGAGWPLCRARRRWWAGSGDGEWVPARVGHLGPQIESPNRIAKSNSTLR